MTAPLLAKLIEVKDRSIFIDGEPVPWLIADETINVQAGSDTITTVYLPVLAERVTVDTWGSVR